jgi:choline-sulfatase
MRVRTRLALLTMLVLASAGVIAALLLFPRRPPSVPLTLRARWTGRHVEKPNVVLITLDTTRADHLGCYGNANARTPALDAVARRGILFAQAATPVPLTLPAHCTIMTGLYPTFHGVRLNGNTALGQDHTTIAEALSGQGYDTAAFIAAFVLDGRWGLNQGFRLYDDQFDLRKFKHLDLAGVQRRGDQVMDAALAWLEGRKDRPFFTWIHLYDAHSPYEPPEPLLSEFRGRGLAGLYDGEIAFADQQVGRLVSWLQNSGLDQKTILVIAGDHGESLGSHGEGTHGYFVYDSVLHVPLIVATPFEDLRGVRVDAQVSLADIFPTVFALAGIESHVRVHGRSLLPLMYRRPDQQVYAYGESMAPNLQYGWSPLHCLRSSRYKFISAPRAELYDLRTDPEETTNIADREQGVAREMSRELEHLIEETSHGAPAPEAANLDRDTVERLRSLGYVGAEAAPRKEAAADAAALADPKDKLSVFAAVQRAGELMVKDDYGEAVRALESALRDEPGMPQARLMLGSCYSELGRIRDAKGQFDTVLKDDPQSVSALTGLASILLKEGKTEDVVTLCKRTLSLDDRNPQAYTLLGDVYIARHEPSKALPYLEKAVEIQPKLSQNGLNLGACLVEVKQLTRAQATLEQIVREHPRFPGAQFNLGVLYEEQGRPRDAQHAYAAEIASYPDAFKAHFNLGKVLSGQGDWAGSNEQMREVIRIAPQRPEGYLFLARGLLHESAPLNDIARLTEQGLGLAQTPDLKALGWFLMADVFTRRHEPAKASEALRRAQRESDHVSQKH